MLIILSALAAVIPMSIYLTIIWRFDRYDREPFSLLLKNYAEFSKLLGRSLAQTVRLIATDIEEVKWQQRNNF